MDSFDDIVRSEKFRSVHNDISLGVDNCARSCQYYRVCGGGAPSNKLFENGDFTSTETVYCRLNQMAVLDVVLELTESLAHELKTS